MCHHMHTPHTCSQPIHVPHTYIGTGCSLLHGCGSESHSQLLWCPPKIHRQQPRYPQMAEHLEEAQDSACGPQHRRCVATHGPQRFASSVLLELQAPLNPLVSGGPPTPSGGAEGAAPRGCAFCPRSFSPLKWGLPCASEKQVIPMWPPQLDRAGGELETLRGPGGLEGP